MTMGGGKASKMCRCSTEVGVFLLKGNTTGKGHITEVIYLAPAGEGHRSAIKAACERTTNEP
jgi:hypothetical protein